MKDFFISYNKADLGWAEWVAWQLEETGRTVLIQAWDFRPSSNFVLEMDKASREAKRTIAILSPDYMSALFTHPEWAAALARDPTGEKGHLLPILVRECNPEGLLKSIHYINLVGLDEESAKRTLLDSINFARAKPVQAPPFPQSKTNKDKSKPFPGKGVKEQLEHKQPITQATREQEEETHSEVDISNLVLLTSGEDSLFFMKYESIEVDKTIRLILLPEDSHDIAFLESLQKAARASIGVAFSHKAELATFESGKLIQRNKRKEYLLDLKPALIDYRSGSGFEISLEGYSSDKIAEMRARRILLDEKIPESKINNNKTLTNLNTEMLEASIQGINTPVRVKQSPFPSLYKSTNNNTSIFLSYGQLLAVLWLRLSGVVEYIYRLALHMQDKSKLDVYFEGRRARAFSNVEPTVIRVEGTCYLLREE
ncbi:MAG: toll/interleukin-1 receptor domain-containing protein [Ignavibacteriales bacterium]